MNKQAIETLKRLQCDYEFYAEHVLKIRAKAPQIIDGAPKKIVPFRLNVAQKYIHKKIEEQKKKNKGRVRSLLLKGRQQGCSTYVGGRFYHKTTQKHGVKTFILTHLDDATNNLFNMVRRYHEHVPAPIRVSTSFSNRKELVFDKLDSSYGLGTAGSKNVGRSDTIDFLHCSEAAFFDNTDEIRTGVMQAAEFAEEIIIESTANGIGNMFHNMWRDAESGASEYIAVFVPWYWQPEYRRELSPDFQLTREETKFKELYQLDNQQIYWRRLKIVELGNPLLFKQEYPSNAAEAFLVTGVNALILPETVLESRKTKNVVPYGAYIVGCDPAREGDDKTAFIRRCGRKAWGIEEHAKLNDMAKAGLAKYILDSEPVTKMFIDRGGGSGMYDRLTEMGYGDRVSLVNFGSNALNTKKYKNRRSEMWGEMKAWLESDEQTQIPDDDRLQADLCAPGYKYTSTTQLQLESKQDIKKRLGMSPDTGDALALTFAAPVAMHHNQAPPQEVEADY